MWDFPILPQQASNVSGEVDALYFTIWALTIFFSVLVGALLVFLAAKYRRGSKADRSNAVDHDIRIELAWSIPPLLIGLGVFVWAARLYASVYSKPPENAMEVFVIGKQWMWHIQHPNGVRENNELHLPVGRPVKLTITSQDVIHSFFMPDFRLKRDAVPGRYNQVWFTPTRVGRYHLFCSEYCGTEHSLMTGWITVMEPADFQQWLAAGGAQNFAGRKTQTMEQAGAELWDQLSCGSCHGAEPTYRGPSLVRLYGRQQKLQNGDLVTVDENYLRESILSPNDRLTVGYGPTMPTYKGQLTEEQVLQLITYIRSLGSGVPAGKVGAPGGPGVEPVPHTGATPETGRGALPAGRPAPGTGGAPAEGASAVRAPSAGAGSGMNGASGSATTSGNQL